MMGASTTAKRSRGAAAPVPAAVDPMDVGLALSLVAARLRELIRPAIATMEGRFERDTWPDWAEPLGSLAYTCEAAAEVVYAAGCELRGLTGGGVTLTTLERVLGDLDTETPITLSVTEAGRRWLEEHDDGAVV